MGSVFDYIGQSQPNVKKSENAGESDYQKAVNYIKQSGLTNKQAFFKKARELGVDPNQAIAQFMGGVK